MIGEKIKELRKENNMTQEDLCKILNIKQTTLSHYESNRRTPDIYTLIKIADFFKVSLDYLCERYKK